jgi:ribose/xylose/arabinose/galactoside ABC-type transport system permease subunit
MQATESVEARPEITRGLFQRLLDTPELGAGTAIVVFFLIFTVLDSSMADPSNFVRIAAQSAFMGLAAYGMTYLMIAGEIDLSAGAMAGLGAAVAGKLITVTGVPEWLGIAGALIVAVLVGLLNSFITLKIGMPSFFATLSTSFVVTGITLIILQGQWLYVVNLVPFLSKMVSPSVFGEVPWTFVFYFILIIIGDFLMRRSKLGPILSATGGNKRAAQVSGINTNLVKTLCFIFVSMCSAIAGLFVMSATLAADQAVGLGWQLWVIAIAIIGGASFSGGVGTILGSFLGTILMMIIRTGLAAAQIQTNAQGVVVGAILVAAAVLDVVRRKMKRY